MVDTCTVNRDLRDHSVNAFPGSGRYSGKFIPFHFIDSFLRSMFSLYSVHYLLHIIQINDYNTTFIPGLRMGVMDAKFLVYTSR